MKTLGWKLGFLIIGLIAVYIQSQNLPENYENRYYGPLRYGLFIPEPLDPSQKYPLITSLHGYGDTTSWNLGWYRDELQAEHPCFVLTPKAPPSYGSWGSSWDMDYTDPIQRTLEVIEMLIEEFPVDTNRVYIYGSSMGGYGTLNVLAKLPGRFAAAMAICGGGDPATAEAVAKTPLWFFHGDQDNTVPPSQSLDLYNAMIASGADHMRYTMYPGVGHDAWTPAFQEVSLEPWLLAQDKSIVHGAPDPCAEIHGYGLDKWTINLSWQPPSDSGNPDNQVWTYEVLRDGQVIAFLDFTDTTFQDTHLEELTSYDYQIRATNFFFESSLSASIQIQTPQDLVSPCLVQCEVQDATPTLSRIAVRFDEAMDRASCQEPNHYMITPSVEISQAEFCEDHQSVVLTAGLLMQDVVYQLAVEGVQDSSLAGNEIAPNASIAFQRLPWLKMPIGVPGDSGSVTLTEHSVNLRLSGSYPEDRNADQLLFVHNSVEGSYELSARIYGLESADAAFRTGLMFRTDLTPGSPLFAVSVDSNQITCMRRQKQGERLKVFSVQMGMNFPIYLKIKRSGDDFQIYFTEEGTDWGEPKRTDTMTLDSLMRVGFFATPLDNGDLAVTFDQINEPLTSLIASESGSRQPASLVLCSWPNPFNNRIKILCQWQLPVHEKNPMNLRIYNILGQCVKHFTFEGTARQGQSSVFWNGEDDHGLMLPSGRYIFELNCGDIFQRQSAVMLK